MQFVHEIINYLTSLPASTWTTLGAYLGGSTLVATALQVAKHRLHIADAKKTVLGLLGAFSWLAASADYLINNQATVSAIPQISHTAGTLLGLAVVVHRFAVSPAYYKVADRLTRFAAIVDKVTEELDAEQPANPTSVAATASGLPANLQQFEIS